MDFSGSSEAAALGNGMIWASSVPGGSDVHSTLARWRRRRPRASLMAIRPSQVEKLESHENSRDA
jgi:hypothetical protein